MSGTQAVTATPVQTPKQPVSGVTRTRRRPQVGGKAPVWVRIAMAIICLMWIVPTLGLAITSFREQTDANSSGWWTVFTSPSNLTRLTIENYSEVFSRGNMGEAFVNSLAITIPATIIPLLIAAFAGYAFTFMSFPGRDFLLILIVGLLVVGPISRCPSR
jgi:alpha-glucoside transport system permease protein